MTLDLDLLQDAPKMGFTSCYKRVGLVCNSVHYLEMAHGWTILIQKKLGLRPQMKRCSMLVYSF